MKFRFKIDFPMDGLTIEEAQKLSNEIVELIKPVLAGKTDLMQYRLEEDTDRSPKNYLVLDENGHATKKKIKVVLKDGVDLQSIEE